MVTLANDGYPSPRYDPTLPIERGVQQYAISRLASYCNPPTGEENPFKTSCKVVCLCFSWVTYESPSSPNDHLDRNDCKQAKFVDNPSLRNHASWFCRSGYRDALDTSCMVHASIWASLATSTPINSSLVSIEKTSSSLCLGCLRDESTLLLWYEIATLK